MLLHNQPTRHHSTFCLLWRPPGVQTWRRRWLWVEWWRLASCPGYKAQWSAFSSWPLRRSGRRCRCSYAQLVPTEPTGAYRSVGKTSRSCHHWSPPWLEKETSPGANRSCRSWVSTIHSGCSRETLRCANALGLWDPACTASESEYLGA